MPEPEPIAKRGLLPQESTSVDRQPTEIVIAVAGWPPIKNEAISLLAAHHGYADRVRALLAAARDEVGRGPFPRAARGDVQGQQVHPRGHSPH